MKTVYILNDTSGTWHDGCNATMREVRRLCRAAGYTEIGCSKVGQQKPRGPIDEADLVLCNGEGTIHHERTWLLDILRRASDRGQRTALVNALFQPATREAGALPKLDLVQCRDPFSQRAWPGSILRPELALHQAKLRYCRTPNRIVWGEAKFDPNYTPPEEPVSLRTSTWDEVVDQLHGSIYVTGEHHGAYAAIAAGAMPLLLKTQTWKLDALADWVNLPRWDGCVDLDTLLNRHWINYLSGRYDFLRCPRLTAKDIP